MKDGKCFWSNMNKYIIEDGKFKHNNSLIDNEMEEIDSKKITDEDRKKYFLDSIKKQVNGFMDNSFDNIIILLGAGASVVNKYDKKTESEISDDNFGKLMRSLVPEVKNGLDNDENVYPLDKIFEMVKHSKLDLENIDLEDFINSLENYLDFCSTDEKVKPSNTLKKIYKIIKNNTKYDYDDKLFKHGELIKKMSDKINSNNKLVVATTNYDTLIEDAAEDNRFTVFDGFTFSYKPTFDDDMFNWNMVKNVKNIKTNEKIYKSNVLDVLKIHGSLTWKRLGDTIIRVDKEENIKSDKVQPVMIFPSSEKYRQSYEYPYFELFTRFQSILNKPNTLLISSGFSFSDSHISRMVYEAIRHNNSLYTMITGYSIENKNEEEQSNEENSNEEKNKKNYLQKFYRLMEKDYPVVFLRAVLNSDVNSLTDYIW